MGKDTNILMIIQNISLKRNTFPKTSEEESITVHPNRGLKERLRKDWSFGGKRGIARKKVEVHSFFFTPSPVMGTKITGMTFVVSSFPPRLIIFFNSWVDSPTGMTIRPPSLN